MLFRHFLTLLLAIYTLNGLAQDRPNIVWITTEDNSAQWMKLYNENGASMPNLEKLAKHGLVFNNVFSNTPVCSAARSTLLSGCYGTRFAAHYHRPAKKAQLPTDLKAYPAYFKDAGYYTANRTKTDYNYKVKGIWDASSKKASYRNRKPGQPFFQVYSLHHIHESCMHKAFDTKKDENYVTNPDSVKVFPYHPDTELFRKSYAHYYDRHMEEDKAIGRIIKRLEKDSLMDNTIIFCYGDHGGVLPRSKGYIYESGLQVPLVVYIPEKWKSLFPAAPGERVDGFVNFIDFAPTVLHLAGIKVPKLMDGEPFLGEGITLEDLNKRDESFSYADRFDEKYDMVRAFRKGKFKYMRSYQPFNIDALQNNYRYKQAAYTEWRDLYNAGKLNEIQSQFFKARTPEALYDLENDPHETVNLANDPKYAKQLKAMRKMMVKQVKAMPDLSFFPESYLFTDALANPHKFGQENKNQIGKLVDIADLNIVGFDKAKAKIAKALSSENEWERYWALIVCSSYGKDAKEFFATAKKMASEDPQLLVRTRAAEFLGLTEADDPVPYLQKSMTDAKNEVELLLVFNTVTLLKTLKPELIFDLSKITPPKVVDNKKFNTFINWRISYISSL